MSVALYSQVGTRSCGKVVTVNLLTTSQLINVAILALLQLSEGSLCFPNHFDVFLKELILLLKFALKSGDVLHYETANFMKTHFS